MSMVAKRDDLGNDANDLPQLTDAERQTYQWQMWVRGFGEEGQRRLKGASVLISRIGGVGGAVAYALAAAGVGKLVLAHGGVLRSDDLNRQILMTHDWIGKPRIESAPRRLKELNPRIEIQTADRNIDESNASDLVAAADIVVACAPLFEERMAMNRTAVAQGKPMVDCAMYEMEASITTILPGRSACLTCVHPQAPAAWKRQFPVFGAVAMMVGAWGAMEAIKLIAGIGAPLADTILLMDMGQGMSRRTAVKRRNDCPVCRGVPPCRLVSGGQ